MQPLSRLHLLVRRMRLELTRPCDHYPLKVACIPISPPAQGILKKLSGKRDSNPRPQPWQGCALPTELFSHSLFIYEKPSRSPFFASAKIDSFFHIRKLYQRKLLIFFITLRKNIFFCPLFLLFKHLKELGTQRTIFIHATIFKGSGCTILFFHTTHLHT